MMKRSDSYLCLCCHQYGFDQMVKPRVGKIIWGYNCTVHHLETCPDLGASLFHSPILH